MLDGSGTVARTTLSNDCLEKSYNATCPPAKALVISVVTGTFESSTNAEYVSPETSTRMWALLTPGTNRPSTSFKMSP
jgi:hypothetical protein